jgi:prenyltransferase beta subunit
MVGFTGPRGSSEELSSANAAVQALRTLRSMSRVEAIDRSLFMGWFQNQNARGLFASVSKKNGTF